MKSVLFLCESLGVGGAERALYTLLTHLNKNRFNITVCTLCDTGHYSTLIKQIPNIQYKCVLTPEEKGIKKLVYKLKYHLIYRVLSARLIYKLFIPKHHNIEIAFCEGFATKILSNSNNKKCRKIAWVHTDLLLNNWPVNIGVFKNEIAEIEAYEKFHDIVGVSNSVSSNLTKLLSRKNNISTIYNIIDEEEINLKSQQDVNINFDKSKTNIVSVGRLAKVKGYDRLIRICARLIVEDKQNICLTIVGGGNEHYNLNNLVTELGVEKHIRLAGNQNNPYPYVKMADLYVCPSYQEGYNIALAEAIVLERPCISTNCSGPDEILGNGKYGCLAGNNDEELYSCLKELVINPDKLSQLQSMSKQRKTFFDIKKSINQVETFLFQ